MKSIVFLSLLLGALSANAGNPLRDLNSNPLTDKEWKAYRAAQSLAKERGQAIRPECVNATFTAGTEPVIVQFSIKETEDEGATCGDPHFSIEVKFDSDGQVSNLYVLDT